MVLFVENNKILVDWFSFTSSVDDPDSIITFLGLFDVSFVSAPGVRGYRSRLYFNGINLHFDHVINSGIWVEMSGSGCRAFETFSHKSFSELFRTVLSSDRYHITRVDIAYDTFDGVIPIRQFSDDLSAHNYVSKFSSRSIIVEYHPGFVGHTLYLGSPQSDVRFRCYDKAYERNLDLSVTDTKCWVRFEVQLRDDHASNFLRLYNGSNLGELFCGVVSHYIRIVKPDKDTNKRRWKCRKWWKNFIGDAEKINLFTKCDMEYNLEKCENYVYRQCGNAIDSLVKLHGPDQFLKDVFKNKPVTNDKYLQLVNDNGGVKYNYYMDIISPKKDDDSGSSES